MKEIIFSIIIPVRVINDYVKETLDEIKKQTFKQYEILVITDEISKKSKYTKHQIGPSYKRNLGVKMSKGKYIAFLDDDSFPDKNWLQNSFKLLETNNNYSAVCGPCLTPKNDNDFQKASGLVWSSYLGSGGAGTYRNKISKPQFVQDYPTVNLIVKKEDFIKIGGFNNNYWPGEDTILCLDIISKLNKKIFYSPNIIVYHHRRNVIIPHLQQITRYAIHRGHFVKKFPKTSFKLGYFIPSMFTIYIFILIFIKILLTNKYISTNMYINLLNVPLYLYLSILFYTLLEFIKNKNSISISILATITIPLTHIYYGFLFIIGLLKKDLIFKEHKVNQNTGKYIGG